MGNCMRRGSANMVWAGDDEEDGEDWGRRRQGRREMDESCGGGDESGGHGGEEVEKQRLLGDDHDEMGGGGGGSVSSSNKSTREVKIKITRKELEELVGRADVQGLSVEQILATLINDKSQMFRAKPKVQQMLTPSMDMAEPRLALMTGRLIVLWPFCGLSSMFLSFDTFNVKYSEKPFLSGLHQVIECPTIRMRMGQGRFGMKPEWICGKVEPMAACVVPSFWFRPISTLEMNHPDLESTSRSSTQGQRPNSFSR
ncbi:hypothetical protein JRO89_XS06G0173700 [Xanthoceras sorbifolium]|uniref:Uncharacterized protein n=1 Tax=Xanthoceras sorbifolium TaxID=99658 RepID=A0ABQ8HYR1_9ROSI|nr:hypothetical protein JRO89_XS06G0173700 [Xanthoceras sorbifolium]